LCGVFTSARIHVRMHAKSKIARGSERTADRQVAREQEHDSDSETI